MPYIGSGLGGQIGMTEETTVGTAKAVDHYYEFDAESLQAKKKVVQARGIRAGNMYDRTSGRYVTQRWAAGDLTFNLPVKMTNLLFRHMIGSPLTRPTLQSAGVYKSVHTPGLTIGKTLTIQEGVPPTLGAAPEPYTYPGAKITDWEISVAQSDLVKLKLTFDAFDELTTVTTPASPALGVASYPTGAGPGNFYTFLQGTLKSGGTVSTTSTPAPVAPGAPTVTVTGTAGTTTRAYKITGYNATGDTLPGAETVITTGNATLTGTNYDALSWTAVPNVTGYKVWVGPSAGGENQFYDVGNVTSFNNQGQTFTAATIPAAATAVATTVTAVTGGTPVAQVLAFKLSGKNGLKVDNFFLGGGTTKAEQNQNAFRVLNGSIEAEFSSRAAFYDLYRSDTPPALQLTFTGPNIPTTSTPYSLDIVLPAIYLEDGASPTISGPDIVKVTIPFTATFDDVDPAIQITNVSDDAAF